MGWKRWIWLVLAIAVAFAGCSSSRSVLVSEELARPDSRLERGDWQGISGYVTRNGTFHVFDGYVRVLPPDSLEFYKRHRDPGTGYVKAPSRKQPTGLPGTHVLPRESVSTLYVKRLNAAKTTYSVIGVTLLAAAVAVAIVAATKESCPFLYSWDGERYVFDGEPYGGATMRGLERTDWSELEHLVPTHGAYRLLITNEVDETQHTNSLALLVVDHPAGTKVVMDREGHPHAFRSLAPPFVARDEAGRNLLPWVAATDRVAWYPDLEVHAREDSLIDTRNHITLAFPRPAGDSRCWLISNLATGSWGSHMIRSMLGMRGRRVSEFYAAIDDFEANRKQLRDWNAREELYELFPEIRCDSGWSRQDWIPGGGPFLSESRATPLDLGGVTGDTIWVRLNPPIGFWSLNSFHLAWEEEDAQMLELAPRSASGKEGTAVLAALRADDDQYLDFPRTSDEAEVVFDAPPENGDLSRTVFARTRGWYEIHLHDLGEPDAPGLVRLSAEPGYAVRRAMREFADYERTGALLGVAEPEDDPER
jgi:hypothetical protein